MLKQVLLATALTCGAATVAFAQSPPPSPTTTTPPASRSTTTPTTPPNTASAPATASTGDFNAAGEMAGSALIGAKIHNDNKDTVGSVDDIYLDDSGNVKGVIVSVGGVLGVGAKNVAVKWEDLKFGKDGKSLMVTTSLTKDALKSMPDYKKTAPAAGGG